MALETATGCNLFSKWKKVNKVVEGAQCVLGNSFVAGTLVHTDQGLKPIEEVKVGEPVKSFNERTGPTSFEPVLELMQHDGTFQLVKVTLDSGESLEATAGHPFYVQGKGWNVAANLKVGDSLRLHNGITLVIKTVETSTYVGRVYNFAVAQNANYFVGMDGVLVHNNCVRKPALPDKYWVNKKAPTQVTPGTRTINDPAKPSSAGGTYHSTTHYDEFGRQIGQTHRTTHGRSDHPNPHHHHHRRDPVTGEKLKTPGGSRTWPGLFGN